MFYSITKKDLLEFVRSITLLGEHHVLAPVKKDNHYEFFPISSPDIEDIDDEAITYQDIDLNYTISHVSPLKTFLAPICNELMKIETLGDGSPSWLPANSLKEKKQVIFFGVHPYDIEAMNIVDNEFAGEKLPDPYYVARRKRMIVIGLDVKDPPPNSFCRDMGAHTVKEGFDIMLTYISDDYIIVETTSEQGDELLERFSKEEKLGFFSKISAILTRFLRRDFVKRLYPESLPMKATKVKSFLIENRKHTHLVLTGENCFECKKCIDVCPTCTCYDTQEIPSLDGKEGVTISNSACCLVANFSRVAGDWIFRSEIGARILNRLMCKSTENDIPGCTGCGRCDAICPTHIASIPDNLRALTKGGVK